MQTECIQRAHCVGIGGVGIQQFLGRENGLGDECSSGIVDRVENDELPETEGEIMMRVEKEKV